MRARVRHVSALALVAAVSAGVHSTAVMAAPFDFKDPKGVNGILFLLDSLLEPIVGLASGITGIVQFDPADPKGMTGTLTVAAESLHTDHQGMKETLHGPDWMDVTKYPTIEFAIKEVKDVKPIKDNAWELRVLGDFSCRGVTKPIETVVRVNFLPDKLGNRQRGAKGDLLVLRSDFAIKRSEFGIKPGGNDVVADEIQLKVSIVGCHTR